MTTQLSVDFVLLNQPDFQPTKDWHVTSQSDLKSGRYGTIKQSEINQPSTIKKVIEELKLPTTRS